MIKIKFFKLLLSTKTFIFSKNALIFLFFLLLSFCFWGMQSMRKKYEVDMNIKISYANIPVHNVNVEELPQHLSATLKEQGYYIFLYKQKNMSIKLDFNDFIYRDRTYYIKSEMLESKLKDILMQSTQILRFSPNEYQIKTVKKVGKKIPVRFNGKITFAQQYSQSDSVIVFPNEIEVFGDSKILDTLKYIYTESKQYNNLKDSIGERIKLAPTPDVTYSQTAVNIIVPVERFTEQTVNVAVTGRNIPEGMTLRTFPTNVNISYFVNASKYGMDDNIKAYIDYEDIVTNTTGKLAPKIESSNPFISNFRCQPAEIDFLLER